MLLIYISIMFIGKARRSSTHQSPCFLFQVIKMCCIVHLRLRILNFFLQLKYTVHFVDFKPKNPWFEISDLVGDFTKKLVTRMDGMPKYYTKLQKKINIRHSWKLISDDRCRPKVICLKVNTRFTLKESLNGKRF